MRDYEGGGSITMLYYGILSVSIMLRKYFILIKEKEKNNGEVVIFYN